MWKWRRRHDRPGDLTLWEVCEGDGEVLWAEMTTDPEMTGAVEQVKGVLRAEGWTQTAGD